MRRLGLGVVRDREQNPRGMFAGRAESRGEEADLDTPDSAGRNPQARRVVSMSAVGPSGRDRGVRWVDDPGENLAALEGHDLPVVARPQPPAEAHPRSRARAGWDMGGQRRPYDGPPRNGCGRSESDQRSKALAQSDGWSKCRLARSQNRPSKRDFCKSI